MELEEALDILTNFMNTHGDDTLREALAVINASLELGDLEKRIGQNTINSAFKE